MTRKQYYDLCTERDRVEAELAQARKGLGLRDWQEPRSARADVASRLHGQLLALEERLEEAHCRDIEFDDDWTTTPPEAA
jgi:hypothetical protein